MLRILVLACALAACANPSGGTPDAADLRTDRTEYTLSERGNVLQVSIGIVFTNGTSAPVFAHGCNQPDPPSLQRSEGGRWVTVYSPIVELCLSSPVRLAPGATYERTYTLSGGLPGTNVAPTFYVPRGTATYRLRWDAVRGSADPDSRGALLPVYSNEFQITR
jgi:hypothetical protein